MWWYELIVPMVFIVLLTAGWMFFQIGVKNMRLGEMLSEDGSSTTEAKVEINEHGIVIKVNRAAVTMFRYKVDELVGKNVTILMAEPYRTHHPIYLKDYLETGIKKIIGHPREVVGRRRDGEEFPILLNVNEWFSIDGHRRTFTGLMRDISSRKYLEAAIQLETLKKKLEEKGES